MSLGAPSNISFVFALKYLAFGLGMDLETPNAGACGIAVNMGYAARIADVERRSDLSRWSETEISDLVAGDESGCINLDAIKDQGPRTENMIRWLLPRLTDPELFLAIASCTPSLWDGLTSWAVMNIHLNARKHSVRPRDLAPSTLDGVMRLGYILRCLDEALGEEPGDPRSYAY